MNDIFFTSDLHFWHKQILNFQPQRNHFSSVEEMNETIIENFNKVITKHSTVYLLGDISFGNESATESVLKRLNGNKILIYGNHDSIIKKKASLQKYFGSCHDYKEVKHNGEKIVCFHFPIESWNSQRNGRIHLHGHCHGNISHEASLVPNRMDVGIDTHPEWRPWSYDEVLEKLKKENT